MGLYQAQEKYEPKAAYQLWKGAKKRYVNGKSIAGGCLKNKIRFEGGNYQQRLIFAENYCPETDPRSDRPLTAEQIRIFLPRPTQVEVFNPFLIDYDQKLGFQKRCDGHTIDREMIQSGNRRIRVDRKRPCVKPEGALKCEDCGYSGMFYFYIQELASQGAGFSQVGVMNVNGVHDCLGLLAQLKDLEERYGSLCESPYPYPPAYGFIPFILSRHEQSFQRTLEDGRKETRHYWGISIAEDPAYLKAVIAWRQIEQYQRLGADPNIMRLPGVAEAVGMEALRLAPAKPQPSSQRPQYEPYREEVVEGELIEPSATYDQKAHLSQMWATSKDCGVTANGLYAYAASRGCKNSKDLTEVQIDEFIEYAQDPTFVEALNRDGQNYTIPQRSG